MIKERSPALSWLFLSQLLLGLATFSTSASSEDKLHHDLDLTFDPETKTINAVDMIDVSGRDQLALKLASGLSLETLTIDGEAKDPLIENGIIWIELPTSGDHDVKITYGGVLEQDTSSPGLSPMLTADGVFLPYGIGWLPNAGAEDGRVTFALTLDVPDPYVAVATGELIDESRDDGRYRAIFRSQEVPGEPPSVFAGAFQIDERWHDDLRLRTYFPAEQQDLASAYLDQTADYIDLFEDEIGDYPYDGFAVIASPLPVGLGFPGATYVSSQILGMPFMLTRSLAHEILHNWWANGVFLDAREGNWAEGLTTYMADYGLAARDSDDAAWQMRLAWLRDFAALPADRDRPISSFRSKGHDADQVVGYNKVAMVFHMLRQELGGEIFKAGLRTFWETYQFKAATWRDLQDSFETASKRELEGFFEPWLTQKGAPSLTLDKADLLTVEDGFAIDLTLSSDRPDYDLLLPVQIETESGIETRRIRLSNGEANVLIDLAEKPRSIGIDQRHDLFRHLAKNEAPPILRDVTLATDTLTMVAANGDDHAGDVAKTLAERTLDTGVRLTTIDDDAIEKAPLMLIGLSADLPDMLAKAGIAPPPESLDDKGTARSWVVARDNAPPALVVEAEDGDALQALLRPLPHYGRQSFIVFDGGRAIDKGVWPTGENALTKRFD